MKRSTLSKLLASATMSVAASIFGASAANAMPVTGVYLEDARCDILPNQLLPEELGNVALFPIGEGIQFSAQPTTKYICVADDLVVNDWEVRMTNVSGVAWTNLFFVGNLGTTIGNADGNMIDPIIAPGVVTDAFRIDGTVTGGINNTLQAESINPNEIFEPGEQWTFYVTNFADSAGTSPPIFMNTPGLFAGSAPLSAAIPDSASILATPVPEPSKFGILGLAIGALFMRRPRVCRA